MKFCLVVLTFFSGVEAISRRTHTLEYLFTGTIGISNLAELLILGILDGEQVGQFNSNTLKVVLKQQWNECVDTAHQNELTAIGRRILPTFKDFFLFLRKIFKQTEGIHTLQWIISCELDEEAEVVKVLSEFGYDGEDFLSLDTNTLTWTAARPEAVSTKLELERIFFAQRMKNFLENERIKLQNNSIDCGRKLLERKVPPEVSLTQRGTLSPGTKTLLCQATGFFPRGVVVTWERDGKEVYVDVEMGETMPNGDGTFQIRSTLRVTPEHLEKHQYSCTVQHSSLEDKVVMTWDPPSSNMPIIIGVVVAVIVLAVIAAVVVVVLRKRGE